MPQPTREQWLELHEAFREYCGLYPWAHFDDEDLVAVENPASGETGYCVVMGGGGIERGLAVYRGDEGLVAYLGLMSGAIDGESEEILDLNNVMYASLADREELSKDERDLIRDLGLRYRGRGRWPMFQAMKPGFMPSGLQADDAEFLALILRSMADHTASVISNGAPVEDAGDIDDDIALLLTRSLVNGEWRNRWEPLMLPMPPPTPEYPDPERLRRLADSKPRTNSVWELSIFYLHLPVGEDSEGRLYFPTSSLLVEADSGVVLPELLLEPEPSDTDRQELLVKQLEALPGLPAEIVVNAPRVGRIVEPVTAPLGIALSVDETPALWAAKDQLQEALDGSLPDFC